MKESTNQTDLNHAATSELTEAINYYYDKNLPVFPVKIWMQTNEKTGEIKKQMFPAFKWKNQREKITRENAIRAAETGKYNSLALLTGPESNTLVIDFDIPDKLELKKLLDGHGVNLSDIPRSNTQGGGLHSFFAFPKTNLNFKTTTAKPENGVDLRGEGGLIFLPPSRVQGGGAYEWIQEINGHLPEAGPEVLNMLDSIFGKTKNNKEKALNEKLKQLSQKQRTVTLEKLAKCETAADRSGADFNLICWLINCNLSRENIFTIVRDVGKFAEKAGAGLLDDYFDRTYENALNAARNDQADQKPDKEFILNCLRNDEKGDAELFSRVFKKDRLFDHKAGSWMLYQGGAWKYDDKKLTRKQALYYLGNEYLKISSQIDKEISGLHLNDSGGGNIGELESIRDGLRKRVKQLNKKARLENVLELSTSFLPAVTDEFDKNPYIINLKNGLYDFKNDKFVEHSAKHLTLKQAGAGFNPGANCPFILEFLNTIFDNNQNILKFVKQWIGITLTGLTDLQGFLYCYGSGANGKTAFFELLKIILGDYYQKIPVESLLAKKSNQTDEYHLASLHGARLVVASEIPQNRRLNESQVKDLTGGEDITARHPYGKPFNFSPTHKLALFGNHLLKISGTDEGIWRRVYLLNFNVTIEKEKRIPLTELKKRFENEIDGFLNWALEGYREYGQGGLFVPEEILNATDEYKKESNSLRGFLESEFCQIGGKYQAEAKTVLKYYLNWCDQNGEQVQYRTTRKLNQALENEGFQTGRGAGHKVFVFGIGLLENHQNF